MEVTIRRTLAALGMVLLEAIASPLAAQPIGPEFRVNTYTTYSQRSPGVGADGAGNFVVVWESYSQDGSSEGIFGQRYASSGARAGAEFRVNTYTTGDQLFPSVATGGTGDFVVAWVDLSQDGSSRGVFGQRYASSGAPAGTEFRVNTYTTSNQTIPSVAADGTGSFVVVWVDYAQDGSSAGIFGQRYASSGGPAGPEFRVNTYTTNSQNGPSVVTDGAGNFAVVWASLGQGDPSSDVFGQRYASSGAPVGAEFRVNAFTASIQARPGVAADGSGNLVVVWVDYIQDFGGTGIFGQRYTSSGAPAGLEFRVNTYTTGNQIFPGVAADGAGSFVVVWESYTQEGSAVGLFGQRYASSGAPAGLEFLVNAYTTGNQIFPKVATDGTGTFVVVWDDSPQDGSATGVFGQRFCGRPLGSVAISVSGSASVCATGAGGTATVTDSGGGGGRTHQWAWRPMGGMSFTPIGTAMGTTYQISGMDFNGGVPGFYDLACLTNPECGSPTFSNTILVTVFADGTPPVVTPPAPSSTTQTLCQ